MHDRPGGRAPAILPPVVRSAAAGATPAAVMAAVLAPGLHAAFDGCLSEALPADLADILGRLDRPAPDSRKRS